MVATQLSARRRRGVAAAARWLFVITAGLLAGCVPETGHTTGPDLGIGLSSNDPDYLVATMLNMGIIVEVREEAEKHLKHGDARQEQVRVAALATILRRPAETQELKVYAVERLGQADWKTYVHVMDQALPELHGTALDRACLYAAACEDPEMIEPLVRSLDRTLPPDEPSAAPQRPETVALERLSGRPLERALWLTLAKKTRSASRVAALDVLATLLPPEDLAAKLKALPPVDEWLTNVQSWNAAFGTLPRGDREDQWVQSLCRPENVPAMVQMLTHHRLLASQPDYVMAPRFARTLAVADDASLKLSRQELLGLIRARLQGLRHVRREPSSPGAVDDLQETLTEAEDRLTRCDLLSIRLILAGLAQPDAGAEILRQGLKDREDTSTEYGGVLDVDAGGVQLRLIPPMFGENDMEYVASDKTLSMVPANLAIVHFHFSKSDESENAGPGVGDLRFARATHATCVVITSLSKNSFDVDYYTPDGAVVDLGIYTVRN